MLNATLSFCYCVAAIGGDGVVVVVVVQPLVASTKFYIKSL